MNYPGRLVIVEGTDGSGKSTQIYLLKKWLESKGYPVVFTEWNSSELVKTWTKKAKQQKQLTPTTFSLIHSSDFFDRYERVIVPLLRAGYIVLADRYIYTAIARDTARGCDRDWVRNTYRDAVKPSLALYFQTPLDIAVNRILVGRAELKYHEAGLDIGFSEDPVESFQMFQGIIKEEYDRMVETDDLTVIDATQPIDVQQTQVRKLMKDILRDYEYPVTIQRSNDVIGARFQSEAPANQYSGMLKFKNHDYPGKIIVVEGSDYSGHYKQSKALTEWLETEGHAVYEAGIKRSKLMRKAIEEAKEEHFVGPHTMALFYATDFADELESGIIPALRAGMVVVADRYAYTLIARQLVRGMDETWLANLYNPYALDPDLTLYLDVPANDLIHRCFGSYGQLSYWESGMDLAISPDPLDSALLYQNGLVAQYRYLMQREQVETVDGTQSNSDIQKQIRARVKRLLKD